VAVARPKFLCRQGKLIDELDSPTPIDGEASV